MTAETIAKALGGRKAGAEWMARCPAHEDREPSLSIKDADGGKVLVRCHAGCDQQKVIAALKARGIWQRTNRLHGTLIRPHVVATAAHCVLNQDTGQPEIAAQDMYVIAGRQVLTDNTRGEKIDVTKIDVAEEVSRLSAHVTEVRRVLATGGSSGKRLDFLMQELNREANTLSSKSQDLEMTRSAVDMKVIIEQMREQVQNVE